MKPSKSVIWWLEEFWTKFFSDPAIKFIDENGVPYGVKHIDNKPRVSSMPYAFDIAEGNVPNHDTFRSLGYNADVGGTEEDLWEVGGPYIFPTAPMRLELYSSSIQDSGAGGINPAGTGIRSVEIHYLDDTWAEQSEVVVLDGTTVVLTVAANILRVNHLHAETTGAGMAAVGNIELRHIADTPIYSYIAIGNANSLQSIWTVPIGKTAFVTDWHFEAASTTASRWARFILKATSHNFAYTGGIFHSQDIGILLEASADAHFTLPLKLPARADVKISIIGSGAGVVCAGAFEGWYES